MDIDLDISGSHDPIATFLESKLQEIRMQNNCLQTVLDNRKQSQENTVNHQFSVEVVHRKIYNNKFTIIYELCNLTNSCFTVDSISFHWDSAADSLNYTVQMFSETTAKCNDNENFNCNFITSTILKTYSFNTKAYVILVFDVPQFFNELQRTISGYCLVNSQLIHVSFPHVKVTVSDCILDLNLTFKIKSVYDLYSVMCSSTEDSFVLVLSEESNQFLENVLETRCHFVRIEEFTSCKLYFYTNHTLITIHASKQHVNMLFFKIYTTNDNQLFALLYEILPNLIDTLIFPHFFYQNYLNRNTIYSDRLLQQFGDNLKKELLEIGKLLHFENNVETNLTALKKRLFRNEKNCDDLYVKVMNMKY